MVISLEALDTEALYAQPPPKFGHDLLKYFAIDPGYINLNHGSFGSTPLPVLKAANEISLEAEAEPDVFHRITYMPRLVEMREQIAKFIGAAKTDEVVLVANASVGLNTILRNIEWEKGDAILVTNATYNSIYRTAQYLSNTPPYPTLAVLDLDFPLSHDQIIDLFREKIRSLPPGKNRVAVIDSIVSNPGVILPWKQMVKICAEEGVLSVVDAAHSIGQEMDINLEEANPDFWVTNLHKWLYVKRGCGALYIPERNQHIIKSAIPTSYAYIPMEERSYPGQGLIEQFEWNGTIDYSPYFTIPSALAFRRWLGSEHAINTYCHALALQGGKVLASILETRVLDPQGDLTLNMVNVQLPLPGTDVLPLSNEVYFKLQDKLLKERKIYSAYFVHNGNWWTRCSAQVYNEVSDFTKLGEAWLEICKEVLEELNLPPYKPDVDVKH
ncbi:pyridoxal phosphate-dependent transferase [Amanita rubescens]|nr:pyridoxal phosphate-dependent transferase [Amanita rubescens]